MKRYKDFINEGLLSAMKPKSDDDVTKGLNKLGVFDKIDKIREYNLDKSLYPSDSEIETELNYYTVFYKIEKINTHKLDKKFYPTKDEIKKKVDKIELNIDKKIIFMSKLNISFEYLEDELDISGSSYLFLFDCSGISMSFYNKYKPFIIEELKQVNKKGVYEKPDLFPFKVDETIPLLIDAINSHNLGNNEVFIFMSHSDDIIKSEKVKNKDEMIAIGRSMILPEDANTYMDSDEFNELNNDFTEAQSKGIDKLFTILQGDADWLFIKVIKNINGVLCDGLDYDELFNK